MDVFWVEVLLVWQLCFWLNLSAMPPFESLKQVLEFSPSLDVKAKKKVIHAIFLMTVSTHHNQGCF
ncbi:hypothetical protein Hanom_Chr14g01293051 [Helianthus anomalus]